MTFELKGYNLLKAHFEETVEIILKKYKVESLEELIEPRRSQIKFINYTIESLDTRLQACSEQTRVRMYAEASRTLNAAMALVSVQVYESLGHLQRQSLLLERLKLGMGITAENVPANFDMNKCYEELNRFFKLVFAERNSRHGLKEEHDLQYIPLDILVGLMKKSYELEELTHKLALAEYSQGGKGVIAAKNFKTDPIPSALIAPFIDWDSIEEELQQLETDELADKNVADIALLSKERAAQFYFLKAIVANLNIIFPDSTKNALKTAILAGAMCIVREQIGQKEYSQPALSHSDIPRSVIHTGLSRILKSKECSPENVEALLRIANDFIMFTTTEPKKHKEQHIFSDIKNLSLSSILELVQSTITTCRKTALDRVVDAHKAVLKKRDEERLAKEGPKEVEATGLAGLLSSMIWSSKPKKDEAPKEEVQEASASASPGQ